VVKVRTVSFDDATDVEDNHDDDDDDSHDDDSHDDDDDDGTTGVQLFEILLVSSGAQGVVDWSFPSKLVMKCLHAYADTYTVLLSCYPYN
jgi:hypothetical protein